MPFIHIDKTQKQSMPDEWIKMWYISVCFPGGAVVKNPLASARDTGHVGSIPGSGRSPGEGNGNPLQFSCLENSMDRGAG